MNIWKEEIVLPKEFPVGMSTIKVSYTQDGDRSFHWHECLEITYIESGSGCYHVNGITYPMEKGDLIIFNNIEPHAWNSSPKEEMVVTVLVFSPGIIYTGDLNPFDCQYLTPFTNRSTTFCNKLSSGIKASKQILSLICDIRFENENRQTGYKLMIKTKLMNILTLLVRHFQDEGKVSEEINRKSRYLNLLQDTLDYMKSNFNRNIRLDELAEIAHMSPSYFSTFFKQTMNISPFEYITKLRVNKADTLIRSTNHTLLHIAGECGFNNMSNFYKAYRKFFGTTPTDSKKG